MSILRDRPKQPVRYSRGLLPLLFGVGGAFLLITAGGWIFGYRGIWAFSHLIFVPPLLRWVMGGALLMVSLFMTLNVTSQLWDSFIALLGRVPLWLWLFVSALLFWLFRERTYSGDALLKLHLLSTETLQTDPYVWKEPLDSFVAYSLAGLFDAFGQPPENAVALLSLLAGILYLASVVLLAKILGNNTNRRIAIILSLIALGSTQLWFGHVENYSLVTAVMFLSVVLAIAYLRGYAPLWSVGLVAGAAVSFHPQALFVLPPLVILLDQRWLRQVTVLMLTGAVVPLLVVGLFALLGVPPPVWSNGYSGDPQLFWTVTQVLALPRIVAALNNLWLLVPFLPLFVLAVIGVFRFRSIWRDRVFIYLSVLTFSFLLYFFFFQNDLPRHRDWDLFASVGPVLSLWIIYALIKTDEQSPGTWRSAWIVTMLFSVMMVATWVSVNGIYHLSRPNANERALFQRYLALDLFKNLDTATVMPSEPICVEAVGCERVTRTHFTMPQDGDTRPVIFAHAPAEIIFPVQLPEREAFIWLSPALDPDAWEWGGDGVTFQVVLQHDRGEELLWSRHLDPNNPADRGWQEALIPLDTMLGQHVRLILRTLPGPANNSDADRAGWGLPWLMGATLDLRYEN